MEPDLVALMGRYCDGDASAFQALYAAVAPRLLAYLRLMVGDRASAEDLLQHTFLKLHTSRSAYVRGAEPLPWLYTIAHRVALDELRRRGRARVRLARGDDPLPEIRADFSGTAEGQADEPRGDPELARAALAALDRLPENQRAALVLTKVQGKSVAEAAAIAGTTPGAIKLRAHRAYVTLRKLLGGASEA